MLFQTVEKLQSIGLCKFIRSKKKLIRCELYKATEEKSTRQYVGTARRFLLKVNEVERSISSIFRVSYKERRVNA